MPSSSPRKPPDSMVQGPMGVELADRWVKASRRGEAAPRKELGNLPPRLMLSRTRLTWVGRPQSTGHTSFKPQANMAFPGPGVLSPVPLVFPSDNKTGSELRLTRLGSFSFSILVLSSWKNEQITFSDPFSSLNFPTYGCKRQVNGKQA